MRCGLCRSDRSKSKESEEAQFVHAHTVLRRGLIRLNKCEWTMGEKLQVVKCNGEKQW